MFSFFLDRIQETLRAPGLTYASVRVRAAEGLCEYERAWRMSLGTPARLGGSIKQGGQGAKHGTGIDQCTRGLPMGDVSVRPGETAKFRESETGFGPRYGETRCKILDCPLGLAGDQQPERSFRIGKDR